MGAKINYTTIFSFISVSVCLSALGLITWGAFYFSNRGYELSDETYYLYFSNTFDPDIYLTSAFGVLNKFFCFGHPTLINLRIAKFIYQTLAVIIFGYSLLRYLKFKDIKIGTTQKFLCLSILLLASYINYDYLPMTLSYNSWSLILALLGMAVVFYEKTKNQPRDLFICSFLFGATSFALFLAKFPNAVILFLVYIISNFPNSKQEFFIKAIGLLSGAVVAFIILLHSYASLKGIINNYWITLFGVEHAPVHPYTDQVKSFIVMCWQKNYLLFEGAIILLAVLFKRTNSSFKTLFFYMIIAINCLALFFFRKGNGAELYNDFVAGSLILINFGLYVYFFGSQQKNKDLILWSCLMLLPFGLMLGTNNEFYYTSSQLMIFAFGGMLLHLLATKSDQLFLSLNGLFMSVFICIVLYNGAVKAPYRQNDLANKTYPLLFSEEIKGVMESRERMIDYTVLNEALKQLNTSDKKVIEFFSHFGIHYLNGCKIFPEPQITDNENLMYINDYLFTRYGQPNDCDLLVMSVKVSESSAFQDMFSRNGIRLNDNFKKVFSYKFLSTGEETLIYKRI